MLRYFTSIVVLLFTCSSALAEFFPSDPKLEGTIIGTTYSVDYNTGSKSTTKNTKAMAFDGDFNTIFASYDRSYTWVGLDLGEPFVITAVSYVGRLNWEQRMLLGTFQGANREDFSDAETLYVITETPTSRKYNSVPIHTTKGFRYVRYVGPNDVRCNVAEIEFYGVPGEGTNDKHYQLSNLPLVNINVEGAQAVVDKETNMNCGVVIVSENGKKVYTDTLATVRGRGNASFNFPKKPMRIKLSEKKKLLNAEAKAKKWTLINNYGDKTLMRNMVAFEIAKNFHQEYVPFCSPVDVIYNGEYVGCYQLCDQVEVGKGRVPVTEMTAADITTETISGGYLLEVDAYYASEPAKFDSPEYYLPITVKSPDSEEFQYEQYQYIKSYFGLMELAVKDKYASIESINNYLNLDSFLTYFLLEELAGNPDAFYSTYFYKERDNNQFFVGPCWDVDLGLNNDNRYPLLTYNTFQYVRSATGGSIARNMKNFVDDLINKPIVFNRLREIWWYHRNYDNINNDYLQGKIDEFYAQLDGSQKYNFMRWPILNQLVHMNPVALGSYDKEVQRIKDYMAARLVQLDAIIGYDPSSVDSVTGSDIREGYAYATQGQIHIVNISQETNYEIYNISGQMISKGNTADNCTLDFPTGIYVVKIGGKTYKLKL